LANQDPPAPWAALVNSAEEVRAGWTVGEGYGVFPADMHEPGSTLPLLI